MEQLIHTLLAYLNNSLDRDINYDIAECFLKNIDRLERFSLDSAADACHVSPSTINRFCKRIGFKNFSYLRSSLAYSTGPSRQENSASIFAKETFLQQFHENIDIIENIPASQLEQIARKIKKSKRIIILGFEKHQVHAVELQKKLFLLGKLSECGTNLLKQIDSLAELTNQDMLITISIQGNIVSEQSPVFEKIKNANSHKLLITFSDEPRKLGIFDEILQCGKIENSNVSSYTLLRLFDVLIAHFQRVSASG